MYGAVGGSTGDDDQINDICGGDDDGDVCVMQSGSTRRKVQQPRPRNPCSVPRPQRQ